MSRPHILLVDPAEGQLTRSAGLLEQAGYLVSTTTGAREALNRLVAGGHHDLVLLNPEVADMDPLAFLREARQGAEAVAIIIVSHDLGFDKVSTAFQEGARDYLDTPFDDTALLTAVKRAFVGLETERGYSRLRKQLARSEHMHRFMVESSPDIIFIIDREGHFTFVNERAEDMLGYRKEELVGEHYSMVIDPISEPRADACFESRLQSARASRIEEVWMRCKARPEDGSEGRRIAIEMTAMGIFENSSPDDHGGRWLGTCTGIYVVARDITDRLAAQKLIHYQAYHDLLTGLPNRALFLDRLSHAINIARRNSEHLAVMFLDLDRFKVVNDNLGHDVGDALLKLVAARLRECLRESDTLARLGGDEFIVLLPESRTREAALVVAAKIVNAVKEPFEVAQNEVYVTASVGVAVYPEDGSDADTLIKNADIAMYHTKDLGKNGYHAYTRELSDLQQRQLRVENDLRHGLRDGLFEVHYQPQVYPGDGRILGIEGLLRWRHPLKGLLRPGDFLAVAEDSGLMLELGEFVLETALRDFSAMLDEGLELGKLALNFSFREIERPDFVAWLIRRMHHYGLPGFRFELEITESTLMRDVIKTSATLQELSAHGITIAVDDFGTGYSSLSLLRELPINRLKIDRSFIQHLDLDGDRAIVEALAHMARGLGLELVAEGVEQAAQLDFLERLPCPVVQGHIFCPSLAVQELRELLQRGVVLPRQSGSAVPDTGARTLA